MFCFTTSLRAPDVSDVWWRVIDLLERTTASVFNQTDPRFCLIVAGSCVPPIRKKYDERLQFIVVDRPAPERTFESQMEDKVAKLKVALSRAQELGARYVMPIDADDLVSSKIVGHVMSAAADGWFVPHGWRYRYGSRWIARQDSFNQVCGTCNIVSAALLRHPTGADDLISNGHADAAKTFADKGADIRPLPFRAAVYTVANGENATRALPAGPFRKRGALVRFGGRLRDMALREQPCYGAVTAEFMLDRSRLYSPGPKRGPSLR